MVGGQVRNHVIVVKKPVQDPEVQPVLEERSGGIRMNDKLWRTLKDSIQQSFDTHGQEYKDEHFLNVIWHVSTQQLPGLEVSVIVDREDNLFISKGTGSFVDYEDESVVGMRIPLKCWIHTHPFGAAYFSNTDWKTIDRQRPILKSAIVLGNEEQMKWWKTEDGREKLCRVETILMDMEEE